MSTLRIVFMATGDIALPSFRALPDSQVLALVTQPDKPVGRKQILTPPAIKQQAIERGIPVLQPESARDPEFLAQLESLQPDLIIVMAYGQILPNKLLAIPRISCINLHASILPKYRGAACIQAAIDAGDSHTGITVMHVVKKLDAGDIILTETTPIHPEETGGELHDRLAEIAPKALLRAIDSLTNGTATRTPQNETESSYVSKLLREHGEIDWNQTAQQLERRIRAYHPWPGTSTTYLDARGRSRRLKIFPPVTITQPPAQQHPPGTVTIHHGKLIVHCHTGAIEIHHLQPDGSRRMKTSDFLLGNPLPSGATLR